jgi:penicillin-binding protein 1A
VNNATVHLARDLGIDYVIRFARRLGIRAALEPNLSLALGTYPVTLLELTRSYGILAKGGRPLEARFVRRVLDRSGEPLLEELALEPPYGGGAPAPAAAGGLPAAPGPAAAAAPHDDVPYGEDGRLIPAALAYLAIDLLRAPVLHPKGTAAKARALGRPLAGKTGTTNSQADAWFVGFSPDLIAGVWVGFDSKEVLGKGETGARAALPIWMDYVKVALESRPPRDFEVPSGVVFARIDGRTGLLAAPDAADAAFQAFLEGTEPHESAAAAPDTAERRRLERLDF